MQVGDLEGVVDMRGEYISIVGIKGEYVDDYSMVYEVGRLLKEGKISIDFNCDKKELEVLYRLVGEI